MSKVYVPGVTVTQLFDSDVIPAVCNVPDATVLRVRFVHALITDEPAAPADVCVYS